MLKGQLSISFVLRIALGFTLVVALSYATLAMDESMKKESQKQTLISVSEYTASKALGVMQLTPGQSSNQTFRLPLSRDYYSGQYSVMLEDINGTAYIAVQSSKWPDMIARHPLSLNTSQIQIDSTPTFPPGLCIRASRNETNYNISITC